jgi:thiol-disulfide isomerase/thioredoxin
MGQMAGDPISKVHRPVPRKTVAVSAAVVIVVAGALIAFFVARSPGSSRTSAAVLPATPTELPTFDPPTFRALLTHLRGKPVVVNFWGSWCGPCIREAPGLAATARAYQGRVQFIGVDGSDHLVPARAFIRRYGWIYPSVFDPNNSIMDSFGLLGQPVTLVFDTSGKQVATYAGAIEAGTLQQAIERALES